MQEISFFPGRIRYKSAQVLNNKLLAKFLNAYIDHLHGVRSSRVCPVTGSILVRYDTAETGRGLLENNIRNAIKFGLENAPAEIQKYEPYCKVTRARDKAKRKFYLFGALYVLLKIKDSLYGKFFISRHTGVLQAASVVTIVGGYPLIKGLYKKFATNIPADSDILLTLIAASFTLMRESSKGVFVLALKALNDYVRLSADAESHRLLKQSMEKTSGMAWAVGAEGQELLIPVEGLRAGDIISVHQGESVPVEGTVTEGRAFSGTLHSIGKPEVIHVREGSRVFEGYSLLSGEIKVSVESVPRMDCKPDLSLDHLLIRQEIKKYQELITRISLGTAAAGFLLSGGVMTALSVMLVLSPSAASAALSTGIKSYVALLNKHRIFIRNPNAFENIIHTGHIVFDKTGTLTYGKMKLETVESFVPEYTCRELIKICAACEADNHHPVSVTLQEEAGDDIDFSLLESSVQLPSKGVSAIYDGHVIVIGNRRLMEENQIVVSTARSCYEGLEKKLLTPVFIGIDGKLAGIIGMRDMVREKAQELVVRLKRLGIRKFSLLTGDGRQKAEDLAHRLGIGAVYSDCTYEDKVRIINDLKAQGTVMMVGDGINDLEAMKAAHVSVSFAGFTSDRVKLNSDCSIFDTDLTRLADLILLSRKAYASINKSIAFARAYNTGFGILALFQCFDAFTAKSLNTMNSMLVLLMNKRIEYLRTGDCGRGTVLCPDFLIQS